MRAYWPTLLLLAYTIIEGMVILIYHLMGSEQMNYGKLFTWLMVAMNIVAPGYGIQRDWRKALY